MTIRYSDCGGFVIEWPDDALALPGDRPPGEVPQGCVHRIHCVPCGHKPGCAIGRGDGADGRTCSTDHLLERCGSRQKP